MLRPSEFELRVLQLLDAVAEDRPVEDSLVEFKRTWPESPAKAARRIAGHCNAARGEPALWLVGVDQKKGEIVGAPHKELADWWPQVVKRFDGPGPDLLLDLAVIRGDATVVALLFGTDRAPFVVKSEGERGIDRETPWREGTRVRSATREDLLRILVPSLALPRVELMDATLSLSNKNFWYATFSVYVTPTTPDRVVIPYHSASAEATFTDCPAPVRFGDLQLKPAGHSGWRKARMIQGTERANPSQFLVASDHDLVLDGPGCVEVTATTRGKWGLELEETDAVLAGRFVPIGASLPVCLTATLGPGRRRDGGSHIEWRLAEATAEPT